MKTLKKRIENSYNANGTQPKNKSFEDALAVISGKRVYNYYTTGSGRYTKITSSNPETYLKEWGIDFETGNDAPRGGQLGNYIQLTAKGKRQTANYRNELRKVFEIEQENKRIEQEKREENRLKFIEQVKNTISENKEWFEENKIKRIEAKNNNDKNEWQTLANAAVMKASKNNFSLLNWSEIYSIVTNKL